MSAVAMTSIDWPDYVFKTQNRYVPAATLTQKLATEPSVLHLTRLQEDYVLAWQQPLPLSTFLEIFPGKAKHQEPKAMEVDEKPEEGAWDQD
eukprot:1921353-Lingulodinium_polyedra.AAC.1